MRPSKTPRQGVLRRSWAWLASGVLIVAICAFAAFEVYALAVAKEGRGPLPPRIGNFPENVKALASEPLKDGFSFAVAGDTKSLGTFEEICAQMRQLPLDFAVLLGDCVGDGTEADHQYLRAELAEEFALSCPVFYVVGNHDVSPDGFTVSRFEETYGPSNFSFEYQGCLFIVLRILEPPYSNEESLNFLRSFLGQDPGRYRFRFVFQHIPLPVSPEILARHFEEADEMVRLFDELKIDYAFAGDFHGYLRAKVHDTTYIVTGGGGSRLRELRTRQFHHALVMRVDKDGVSEWFVPAAKRRDVEDVLEHLAIVHMDPWLRHNRSGAWLVNGAMLAALMLGGYVMLRPAARRRSKETTP